MILLLLACNGDDAPTDSYAWCDDQPVVTWDNFGAGFVTEHCQTCHASTADNRVGAPEDVTFDSKEEVWAQKERVLARVLDSGDMPPQGGTTGDDDRRLEIWLTCADEGT